MSSLDCLRGVLPKLSQYNPQCTSVKLVLLIVTTLHLSSPQLRASHSMSFTSRLFFISIPASLWSLCSCTCMCCFVMNLKKGSSYQKVSVCTYTHIGSPIQVSPSLPFTEHLCAQVSLIRGWEFCTDS